MVSLARRSVRGGGWLWGCSAPTGPAVRVGLECGERVVGRSINSTNAEPHVPERALM